jgi:hypothetical protein
MTTTQEEPDPRTQIPVIAGPDLRPLGIDAAADDLHGVVVEENAVGDTRTRTRGGPVR